MTFTNTDAVAHQVEFKGAGVTCPANPFVLQKGQSGACTFTVAGTFAYSDPNKKGNTYRGHRHRDGPARAVLPPSPWPPRSRSSSTARRSR